MQQANQSDDRTNAVGLFNTARSFWQSGVHLEALGLKVTHPSAPVTFCLCHAIELYLKAFLRGRGRSVADLKNIGHSLSKLATAAGELDLDEHGREVLSHIEAENVAIEARYIVTGFKSVPTNDALASLAQQLDQKVGAILMSEGFAVRKEVFPAPRTSGQVDELRELEEYIPHMTPEDRQIIGHLLHHNHRMFTAERSGGHARLLVSRGIVRIVSQHGQLIDYEDVPFEVPKHLWDVLVKHKAQFPYRPSEDGADPWRVHWTSR